MGDRFRSMIESEFAEVEPPPIGDLVDNAIRDGQRLRRTRLVQRSVACVAAVGALALGLGMATAGLGPEQGPDGPARYAAGQGGSETARPASAEPSPTRTATPVPADAPTMAIFEPEPSAPDVASKRPVAAPATVLGALQTVLPDGPTVAFAGSRFNTYTGVQVYLDRGFGYGMIRVALARYSVPPKCESSPAGVTVNCRRSGGAWVETYEIEDNCVQRRGVTVYRTDGLAVQVNIGSCLVDGPWPAPGIDSVDEEVIKVAEAIDIGLSSVWTERSLESMEKLSDARYPSLPMLTAFNGVGA